MLHKNIKMDANEFEKKLLTIYEKSLLKCIDLQPWSNYYLLRFLEFKILTKLYQFNPPYKSALEVGVGNAFITSLISTFSQKIVGMDLINENLKTHTYGIYKSINLVNRLNIGNCSFCGGSVEKLPFRSDSFDLIYCQYVLHYLTYEDKNYAINELRRVLTKDGILIFIAPGFMERVWAPIVFYNYLFKRLVAFSHNKKQESSSAVQNAGPGGDAPGGKNKGFFEKYPHFPFPNPHGNYKNNLEELIQHLPSKWLSLFERNGFKVVRTFTSNLIQKTLIDSVCSSGLSVFQKSVNFHRKLGAKFPFKNLGENFCIIAKK